jgi:hypothetical protein
MKPAPGWMTCIIVDPQPRLESLSDAARPKLAGLRSSGTPRIRDVWMISAVRMRTTIPQRPPTTLHHMEHQTTCLLCSKAPPQLTLLPMTILRPRHPQHQRSIRSKIESGIGIGNG